MILALEILGAWMLLGVLTLAAWNAAKRRAAR